MDAIDEPRLHEPITDLPVRLLIGGSAILFSLLGLARFFTVHNETFDLAFYTRMSWGLVNLDFWEPIVDAHFYGLHLSPVLVPFGALGLLVGTPPVLIVAQALALSLAAVPIAQIAGRHLGEGGPLIGAAVWLAYPNLAHVAGYEFHPGSLAVLPLAWAAWAIDRGSSRAFGWSVVGVLACREDLALVTAGLALLYGWRHRESWPLAVVAVVGSVAYFAFFLFVLHPQYAPETGSLELHFGQYGDSPVAVVLHLATHPADLVAHLSLPRRLLYLPKILAPLLFLPLLRPGWWLPVLPTLAINLISAWPTTTDLDVHYLTPALPFLVVAAIEAAGRGAWRERAGWGLLLAVGVGHVVAGGTPVSRDFEGDRFRADASTRDAYRILDAIEPDATVQAPMALLPHVAERRILRKGPPPEARTDLVLLDVAYRLDYPGQEDVLRTVEEPLVRTWLARDDHGLRLATPHYLLLERGLDPRDGVGASVVVGGANPDAGIRLAACLRLLSATRRGTELALELVATGPCEPDLAVRIGSGERPQRVDLLFDGLFSPAHVRRGDRLRSVHGLNAAEVELAVAGDLRVGLLRSSGARPEHADPKSVELPPL